MNELLSKDTVRLCKRIEAIGVPIMIGGGVAAIFFGEPRTTIDSDVVIDVEESDAQRIVDAFDPDEYYVPPFDTVQKEIRRGGAGHFKVIHPDTGLKADPYPAGEDPLNRYGLSLASIWDVQGVPMRFAPVNYVIAMKLRYYQMSEQDKHLRDIRAMLAVSPVEIDHAVVERWARKDGALEAWHACERSPGAE